LFVSGLLTGSGSGATAGAGSTDARAIPLLGRCTSPPVDEGEISDPRLSVLSSTGGSVAFSCRDGDKRGVEGVETTARESLLAGRLLVSDLSSPARDVKEELLPGRTIRAPPALFFSAAAAGGTDSMTGAAALTGEGEACVREVLEFDFVAKVNFSKGEEVGRAVGLFFGKLIPAITLAIFSSKVSTLSTGFAAEGKLLDGGNIIEADKAPTDLDCDPPLGGMEVDNLNEARGAEEESLSLSSFKSSDVRFSRFNPAMSQEMAVGAESHR
jgi:hypothetical protein